MALALVGEKIDRNRFTGEKIENSTFFNCDFSGADLSGTEFIGCQFYDRESQKGCNFSRAMLKDAIFKSCDLSMADFRNASALGIRTWSVIYGIQLQQYETLFCRNEGWRCSEGKH